MAEQWTENPCVISSSLIFGGAAADGIFSSAGEHRFPKPNAVGSSPTRCATPQKINQEINPEVNKKFKVLVIFFI